MIGPKGADITIVTWGSGKLAAQQAMQMLNKKDINILHFHIFGL